MFKLTSLGKEHLIWLLTKFGQNKLAPDQLDQMVLFREIDETGFTENLNWSEIAYWIKQRYIELEEV